MFAILAYILIFATMGFYLYIGTLEGVTYFKDIYDSAFNLMILLTTANFPDVMLPAYADSRVNCLFFIMFLIIGLFFLLNLLLAVFFNSYKRILEERVAKRQNERSVFFKRMIKRYDTDKSGFLSDRQFKNFLTEVFDFNFKNYVD